MAALSGLPWHQILFAAYAVWVVGACVTILLARRSPAATLAWIFAFVALPVVSGLYYLVFGPRRLARRRRRYAFARGTPAGEVSSYLRASRRRKPNLPPHSRAPASFAHGPG